MTFKAFNNKEAIRDFPCRKCIIKVLLEQGRQEHIH